MYRNFRILLILAFFILTTYYMLHATAPSAHAQTMSNQDYIIKLQDLDTIPADTLNTQPKLEAKTLNSNISEGVNFKVKSGFDNVSLPFSIYLSADSVNFGELVPTNPIVRTVHLKVNNAPSYGYSVLAFQDHALKSNESAIPNTTCDNGLCDEKTSENWTNILTYGFGYRCGNLQGFDCDKSFLMPNFYKHFSDSSLNQSPQAIVRGESLKDQEARISYKVNISGTQTKGVYLNTITYIAVPNF